MKTHPNAPVTAADAAEGRPSIGLTKREHFAALAMQGILANPTYSPPRRNSLDGMATDAVAAADALIAALNQEMPNVR